jgi:hypothetical protein
MANCPSWSRSRSWSRTKMDRLRNTGIYIPGAGASPKKLGLRLQQKVAAPRAPAPQHCAEGFKFRIPVLLLNVTVIVLAARESRPLVYLAL